MTTGSPTYCIDTSAFITAWNETYRPTNFATFWQKIESLIADGRAVACQEVKRELTSKDDAAGVWAKAQDSLFVELENEQLVIAQQLVKDFPSLAKQRLGRYRADGFVIALAIWKGLTVVTAENRHGADKIPTICEAKKVDCISLADMIEIEDWSF